jgi:hypothetical protein
VLAGNIRRHLDSKRLRRWSPQQRALAILGTADGRAIGIRGTHASASRAWWWAKKWIDRRWMAKYINLKMPPPSPPAMFAGQVSAGYRPCFRGHAMPWVRCENRT